MKDVKEKPQDFVADCLRAAGIIPYRGKLIYPYDGMYHVGRNEFPSLLKACQHIDKLLAFKVIDCR